jgi:predicted transcriptional regulator
MRTVAITARVPTELVRRLDMVAKARGVPRSAIIIEALRVYLRRRPVRSKAADYKEVAAA